MKRTSRGAVSEKRHITSYQPSTRGRVEPQGVPTSETLSKVARGMLATAPSGVTGTADAQESPVARMSGELVVMVTGTLPGAAPPPTSPTR